ncbi:MOSC domain-containing protein [Yoonia sp. BS5-3]|uniref:MOSC domain-containing protein n=1 Tax=Yoonia phaeophyticola TaxID=3137369 RepID=A0ABZ2V7Y8_9RHOB
MCTVAALWRHPIKSHGREALDTVTLIAGQTMPWDRHWAVTHDRSKFDAQNPAWVTCRNFMIGVSTPGLAGLWATLDTDSKTVTLQHQSLGSLTFQPDNPAGAARFVEWVQPLCPPDKFQPTGIVSVQDRGMTDSKYPTVSIMNLASHAAVAEQLGKPLEYERWRGNIWLDGLDAWEENNWIGKDIRIGDALLRIHEPIERCMHTAANPHTGERDTDTLGALRGGWGHQNFGVNAEVIEGGQVTLQNKGQVL